MNRVFSSNGASVALARRYGFEQVGHMRELVYRDGEYVDCVSFQLMLPRQGDERASTEGCSMEPRTAASLPRSDR